MTYLTGTGTIVSYAPQESVRAYLRRKARTLLRAHAGSAVPAEEESQQLTLWRTFLIVRSALALASKQRILLLKCFVLSAFFAIVGAIADVPASALLTFASHQGDFKDLPFWDFVPITTACLVVITVLNVLLPGGQGTLKARIMMRVGEALCMDALIGWWLKGSVKSIQPQLKMLREKAADLTYSIPADAAFYVRSPLILGYFAWQAYPVAFGFVCASFGGIAVYGVCTHVIGILMGDLYKKKQETDVVLSRQEIKILKELDQKRSAMPVAVSMISGRDISILQEDLKELAAAWQDYKDAYIGAEVLLVKYSMFGRDLVLEITKMISVVILTYYAYYGKIEIGMVPLLVGLIPKGAEIFTLYSQLQKRLLETQYIVTWAAEAKTSETDQ